MSLITRLLTTAAAVVALCAGGAVAATADTAGVREDADRIMNLSYGDFAEHPRDEPFDWSTDGCTGIGEFFAPACVQHDFGYRNYGAQGTLKLSPVEDTRKWIDDRFLSEMRRLCRDTYGQSGSETDGCLGAAAFVYQGVRTFGGAYYF